MPHPGQARLAGALVTATLLLSLSLLPAAARAEPGSPQGDTEACFGAAEKAQPLMRQNKLREAREELEICGRDVCPRVARGDCRDWLTRVSEMQPSIVIAAHEVRGEGVRDVYGVRLIIDDTIVIARVDSRPIEIDPGPHRLRFERAGAPLLEQDVEIEEGKNTRVIDVYWRSSTTAESPQARPVPPLVYVMGAVGLGVLGAGTYFEVDGLSRRAQLDRSCKATRSCSSSDVDLARNLTRIGDVTLGVGALTLAGTTIMYLTRPTPEPRRHDDSVGLILQPAPGGFFVGLRGSL